MPSEFAPRVRHAIYRTFADGGIPKAETIARQLRMQVREVHASMHQLHDAHAIVLDPGTGEPRMALPISAVPTPHLVEGGGRSWFANCAWDAFGIPLLVGVDAVISTSFPDCDARIVYRVENGGIADASGVVHFAVPAARWWENIAFT